MLTHSAAEIRLIKKIIRPPGSKGNALLTSGGLCAFPKLRTNCCFFCTFAEKIYLGRNPCKWLIYRKIKVTFVFGGGNAAHRSK